ncbi:N-acetylmuramoyl-L-alanine amidase [Hyphomicrobium sp.]|uniref:N-acetylmuramoyl-L-alanine amidase n=1 Tax=Hyphomicrobium sp. TaxID=82 RepID=UPI002BF30677|nr:N-acetylmuramoyl-L-alanine amidase [Hyphomicrobium sp.]HRN86997.1 N-acetylmuramoyl-L-alanine amidase [Hyphomicrobium sp.]HRQ28372.1 N-acetylmuramoyl-L-alanine amidase [Hyphomicrobium sp.]
MTIGLLQRFALQLGCALLALAFPLAASATGGGGTPAAMPLPTQKSLHQAKSAETATRGLTTGALSAAAKAKPGADAALGGDVMRTRFLIGLPRETEFQVFSLANPNRVIVDVSETALQLPPQPDENIAVGLVRNFRAGQSGPGKSRVIIKVTRPVIVESATIVPSADGKGHRLALDIVPVAAPQAAAKQAKKASFAKPSFSLGAASVQPPLPVPATRPDEIAARSFKPIIVIDPGHGGHDSGAKKHGAVEKDVVLAFSLMLRDKLEETGRYKVLMTRDTDVFVALDDRRRFAEQHGANLFIAVHADYAQRATARGATIYSLRENVASSLKRSAKGKVSSNVLSKDEVETMNKVSADGDLAAVRSILADLAGREVGATQERTNVFTRSVIEYMGASTEMRAKPDQQAAFRVLRTAQFPSVLIELAYVTNKQDAALLKSDSWRDKVSDSIMDAIENYFSNQIARLPL